MLTNTYSIYSGKNFNEKFGNKRLIKFTNFENDKFDFLRCNYSLDNLF